jgi:hypothetical protein
LSGAQPPSKDLSSLEFVGGAAVELAIGLEPFLDQIVFIGGMVPWYLLSEGLLSRQFAEGERPPAIPTGPQVSEALDFTLGIDLYEPSQYDEIIAELYGYREVAPQTGRYFRLKQGTKINLELISFVARGVSLPGSPTVLAREGAGMVFDGAKVIALQGYDFQGMLRSFSLRVAPLAAFLLFRTYAFARGKEARHIIEICYILEFLRDGPVRGGDELRRYAKEPWASHGLKKLREFFDSPDAAGPVAYAKEHGVSLPAAIRFRRQQAYTLVRRLLNRVDGIPDDY